MLILYVCCAILGDTLKAGVWTEKNRGYLSHQHAREMGFTGRAVMDMV